jgi:hypothetical protein
MEGMKVYIVCDCGQNFENWPASGAIFGVYDTEKAAKQRLQDLEDHPESVNKAVTVEDITVREFIINQASIA